MKLETKHLAPYLPYRLNLFIIDYKLVSKLELLGDSHIRLDVESDFYFNEVKPILRPLSDLTKEIEHNGNKFIPALELVKEKEKYKKWNDNAPTIDYDIKIVKKPFGKILKVSKLDQWVLMFSFDEPERSEYFIVQKLFKWHFDVFGLIEKGLAIDINSIENVSV